MEFKELKRERTLWNVFPLYLHQSKTDAFFAGKWIAKDNHLRTAANQTARKALQSNLHVRPPLVRDHLCKTPKLSQFKSYSWNLS